MIEASETRAFSPKVSTTLTVAGQLDGASIRFSTPIVELAERNRIPCYGLSRPRRIKHGQRRLHERFAALERIQVFLVDSGAKLQKAVLHDISLGGLAASVAGDGQLTLSRGDCLGGCTVKLPEQTLQCALEVRHVQHDECAGHWLFGARFIALSGRHQRGLNDFITATVMR